MSDKTFDAYICYCKKCDKAIGACVDSIEMVLEAARFVRKNQKAGYRVEKVKGIKSGLDFEWCDCKKKQKATPKQTEMQP